MERGGDHGEFCACAGLLAGRLGLGEGHRAAASGWAYGVPITLTGLGERVHLAGPQIDLDTHITDVVNVITYADLHDVVLVGHSYAGTVVNGVADRIPERLARVVYVDTAPLPDGVAQADFSSPEETEAYGAAGDGAWRWLAARAAAVGGARPWREPERAWAGRAPAHARARH